MIAIKPIFLLSLFLFQDSSLALNLSKIPSPKKLQSSSLPPESSSSPSSSCRRGFLTTSIASSLMVFTRNPQETLAASKSYPQETADKENLIKGYKRLNFLLNNWEKETTICGRTDNPYIGCERTPEKVMEYLGFKSMNDPLFRIDKTLFRLQALVGEDDIDYMEAMELVNQAVEDGNGIAFVSSWGEANPGGGKDRIDLFIERAKRFVIATRDGLGTIIKILDLKVD
mmetsp:Transcript_11661/g.13555  ORF Transcript_11661/g.13555 Transcript_11661/m.13555 type:complete len:228 (+) Transcript_11661:147-830(+)